MKEILSQVSLDLKKKPSRGNFVIYLLTSELLRGPEVPCAQRSDPVSIEVDGGTPPISVGDGEDPFEVSLHLGGEQQLVQ